MVPVLIIVGLFAVYELMNRANVLPVASSAVVAPPLGTTVAATDNGVSAGTASAIGGANAALNFVPVVGPVLSAAFNAISGGLLKASAQRAAQAKNENSAVAAAVPGWDQAIAQIVAAYNAGTISASQTVALLNQTASNFWNEVTPQIQPGRNGCNGGKSCAPPANVNSATNLATTASSSYCSGSIGASCCVGCVNIAIGVSNMTYAVTQVDTNGGSMAATIPQVFASKYGGINRPQYKVTFTKPGAATVAAGGAQSFLQTIGL